MNQAQTKQFEIPMPQWVQAIDPKVKKEHEKFKNSVDNTLIVINIGYEKNPPSTKAQALSMADKHFMVAKVMWKPHIAQRLWTPIM